VSRIKDLASTNSLPSSDDSQCTQILLAPAGNATPRLSSSQSHFDSRRYEWSAANQLWVDFRDLRIRFLEDPASHAVSIQSLRGTMRPRHNAVFFKTRNGPPEKSPSFNASRYCHQAAWCKGSSRKHSNGLDLAENLKIAIPETSDFPAVVRPTRFAHISWLATNTNGQTFK
jgi:hypothetical protein